MTENARDLSHRDESVHDRSSIVAGDEQINITNGGKSTTNAPGNCAFEDARKSHQLIEDGLGGWECRAERCTSGFAGKGFDPFNDFLFTLFAHARKITE